MRSQHLGHLSRTIEHQLKTLLDRQAREKIQLESELTLL